MPCDSCRRGLCASARAGLSEATGAMHWSLSNAMWKGSVLSSAALPAIEHARHFVSVQQSDIQHCMLSVNTAGSWRYVDWVAMAKWLHIRLAFTLSICVHVLFGQSAACS